MTAVDSQSGNAHSVQRRIDAIWRIESPKLIAALLRMTRDLSLAEDVAQDALLAALETWPDDGIPEKPGAWLMTAAKRRALDHWRHEKLAAEKHSEILHEQDEASAMPDIELLASEDPADDMLRLMFIACHPLLKTEARIALTLRLLGGLTTEEIARAFLQPEATVAQRIVRAKKRLASEDIKFETPGTREISERLHSVLEVIYLVFNEGYSATRGEDWLRPALCQDALRLGRMLTETAADNSEVHALVALMELQASRFNARTDAEGAPILLEDQDRARWNPLMIRRGLAALEKARRLAESPGTYLLQAEIAACHARARKPQDTDWQQITLLYELLGRLAPSPVIELNRAVAICMAFGPEAALPIIDALLEEPTLRDYHLLPSVRGDFLFRLQRLDEAREEFQRAADMTDNMRERELLLKRAAACANENRRSP